MSSPIHQPQQRKPSPDERELYDAFPEARAETQPPSEGERVWTTQVLSGNWVAKGGGLRSLKLNAFKDAETAVDFRFRNPSERV